MKPLTDGELARLRTKVNRLCGRVQATVKEMIERELDEPLDQAMAYEELGDRVRDLESRAAAAHEEQQRELEPRGAHPSLTAGERNRNIKGAIV
jgi:predicted DNA-binding protein